MAEQAEACLAQGSQAKPGGSEGMYLVQLWSDLLKA